MGRTTTEGIYCVQYPGGYFMMRLTPDGNCDLSFSTSSTKTTTTLEMVTPNLRSIIAGLQRLENLIDSTNPRY